jgi:hypothetical protein
LLLLCAQVRRAYKKAALALHPDKALAHCRFAHRMGPAGAKLAAVSQVRPAAWKPCMVCLQQLTSMPRAWGK